jgi:FixJ family two-component response regulator
MYGVRTTNRPDLPTVFIVDDDASVLYSLSRLMWAAHLPPREREVLTYVIAGRMNKQIAASLGTAEKTIKVHRGRMMVKLGVRSVADLVRLSEAAGIAPVEHSRPLP